MAVSPDKRRQGLRARIAVLCKELHMDDADYREALYGAFRVRSSTALTDGQLAHFADMLARHLPERHPQRRGYPGKPHNLRKPGEGEPEDSRNAQLRKVEAQIAEAGYPWSYADVLARRICGVARIAWVPEEQLYKIITALQKDAQRCGRDTG